jgi:hypothetical protein
MATPSKKLKEEETQDIVRDVRDTVLKSCRKMAAGISPISQPVIPGMIILLDDGEKQLCKLESLLLTAKRASDAKDATIAALRSKINVLNRKPVMVNQETNTEEDIDEMWLADVNMF